MQISEWNEIKTKLKQFFTRRNPGQIPSRAFAEQTPAPPKSPGSDWLPVFT